MKERVLKMATLVDQADESELLPPTPMQVDTWTQSYINIMGAPPQEEEEPTGAQLAALNKKLEAGLCPYVDFSVWTPFERRTSRAQKFRVYQPLGDGSYLLRELPGPANLSTMATLLEGLQGSGFDVGGGLVGCTSELREDD